MLPKRYPFSLFKRAPGVDCFPRTINHPGCIGVGNGDPSCHEPDKGDKRSAFNGLCMALVHALKTPGEIRVEASTAGLEASSVVIVGEPAPLRVAAN